MDMDLEEFDFKNNHNMFRKLELIKEFVFKPRKPNHLLKDLKNI